MYRETELTSATNTKDLLNKLAMDKLRLSDSEKK